MTAELPSAWLSSRAVRLLALGGVVLLGAYLRLGAAALTVVEFPIRADAAQYVAYAYNMRLHDTYSREIASLADPEVTPAPDALRSPGYPGFLYLFAWTSDLDRFAKDVVFAQALISVAAILATFALAVPVVGYGWALGVALLTALSPHLVTANTYLLSEALFGLVLLLALLWTWRSQLADARWSWLVAGSALGAAALVRPSALYLVVFVAVSLAFRTDRQTWARATAFLGLGYAAVVGAWVLRNWIVLGIVGDDTLTIATLHHGMYPGFLFDGQSESFGFPYRFDPESERITASLGSVVRAIADRFRADFWDHAAWYLQKPLWLFRWGIIQGQGDIFVYPTVASPYYDVAFFATTREFMRSLHPVLVWLALGGALLAWLPRAVSAIPVDGQSALRLVSVTYLYFIAVHVAGAPFPRYSIPIRPLTYILAVVPLACLPIWWRGLRGASALGGRSARRATGARSTE